MNPKSQQFPIERYALLTESAPELRGRLDEWYEFYLPDSPGECELIDISVMSSVQRRRVLSHMTETVNQQIRTAVLDFDRAQEDEVQRFRDLLDTNVGAGLLGLKRLALGCRFLISRWERLIQLLKDDGTWLGNDRNEAIRYMGARASKEHLPESEGAYLTWLYCIIAQKKYKDKDLIAMGHPDLMPASLKDREARTFLPPKPTCQQILEDMAQRELGRLRVREEHLRVNYEVPARNSAEARRQLLDGPQGALCLRHMRLHELQFYRAYQAFLKGREATARTGRPPGAPDRDEKDETTAAISPGEAPATEPVEEAKAQRQRAADVVAPDADNGIGAAIWRGDGERATAEEGCQLMEIQIAQEKEAEAAALRSAPDGATATFYQDNCKDSCGSGKSR